MSGTDVREGGLGMQAHVAMVTGVNEVRAVLAALYKNNKIARATHNMYAYRIHDTARGGWRGGGRGGGRVQYEN